MEAVVRDPRRLLRAGAARTAGGALRPLGYELHAFFALFRHAIEYFGAGGLKWSGLGAGAGINGGATDRWSRLKRGWSTGTRMAYFCGRIFDPETCARIIKLEGADGTDCFPACRKGEFGQEWRGSKAMAKVVIFGVPDMAELAHFYLRQNSAHEVAVFSITKEYLRQGTLKELGVVPFENVQERYPCDRYRFFVPMTGRNMNRQGASICWPVKDKAHGPIFCVSSRASVFPGTPVGGNCFVLEDNTIQPFVSIGNNVVPWAATTSAITV